MHRLAYAYVFSYRLASERLMSRIHNGDTTISRLDYAHSPNEVQSSLSDGKEVLLLDYEKVARQVVLWSQDETLPPHKRNLAGHLAYLTRILSDARYGCPTEHQAAEVMYRYLHRSVESRQHDNR